jgi:hypothetical protein|tara:strand:- start:6306 stop:7334 length:1029 start_codon:yes stop_codon:yes gene_type:complete
VSALGADVKRLFTAIRRRVRWYRGRLNWTIQVSAPNDETAKRWGDTAFADDLSHALEAQGQVARVQFWDAPSPYPLGDEDVVISLLGLHRWSPGAGVVNYLWIISHPDEVSGAEADAGWTRIFAASSSWARLDELGAEPLLQAASASRFDPSTVTPRDGADIVFVGTSRGVRRPVISDAIRVGAEVAIYGHDWGRFVPPEMIRAEHLPFAEVPSVYAGALVVLNDHWDDMRRAGFLSNRLFDAAFVGSRVISDDVPGIREVFGGLVRTYSSDEELVMALAPDDGWPDSDERDRIVMLIRREHSFDARARQLIAYAREDGRHAFRSAARRRWRGLTHQAQERH